MKIGQVEYRLARPHDLDEQLIALTGCNAAEICAQLRSPAIPSSLANALLPYITGDKPDRHELAERIAKAGADDVRAKVLALYEKAPEAAAAQEGEGDAKAKAKG